MADKTLERWNEHFKGLLKTLYTELLKNDMKSRINKQIFRIGRGSLKEE